jgi:hypothetical protein
MASLALLAVWCAHALVKDEAALVFERNREDKTLSFLFPERGSVQITPF